jgi:hypothetical protein
MGRSLNPTPGRHAPQSGPDEQTVGVPPFRGNPHQPSLDDVATYLIEAYASDPEIGDLQRRAGEVAATMTGEGRAVRYRRSLILPADETCFHVLDAASLDDAAEFARRAHLTHPPDRPG